MVERMTTARKIDEETGRHPWFAFSFLHPGATRDVTGRFLPAPMTPSFPRGGELRLRLHWRLG